MENNSHRKKRQNTRKVISKLPKFIVLREIVTDKHYLFFQGDYIWIEPVTRREFDVAIGAKVISADGRKIQVCEYQYIAL